MRKRKLCLALQGGRAAPRWPELRQQVRHKLGIPARAARLRPRRSDAMSGDALRASGNANDGEHARDVELSRVALIRSIRRTKVAVLSRDVHDLASFRWLRRAPPRRGPCDATSGRRFRRHRSGVLRRTGARATRSAPDAIAVRYVGAAWGCPSRTSSTSSTIPPL
jgi:hypothetical protein